MDLFKLVGSVFVETDKANESLSKTDEKAKKTGATFGDVAKKAGAVGAAVVGASATAVTGIVKLAQGSSETADEIDKMSQKLGMSREGYQEWDYVLSQAGVEINSMETGMKTLTNKIDDAKNGSQKALDMFKALGISLEDLQSMSREDIFEKTIAGFQSMEDSTERAALANDVFGKSGQNLIPLFNETAEGTQALIDKAHDLGMVLSDDTVSAGVELHDTMDTLQRSFSTIVTNLGGAVMPLVNEFANIIIGFMPFIQSAMQELGPLLQNVFSRLMPPLMELAEQLFPVVLQAIQTILPIAVDLASQILPAIVEILQAILPILPPILALIEEIAPFLVDAVKLVLPLVVKFIQNLMPFFVKICEAILPVLVELLPLVMEILEAICPILDLILDVLGFLLDIFGDLIQNTLPVIINLIKNVLTPILRVVTTVISAVGQAFRSVFDGIKNVWQNLPAFFTNIWNGIKNAFGAVGTWFKDTFSKAWQAVKDVFSKGGKVFNGIKEGIANVFHNVVNTIIRGLNAVIAAPFNAINNIFNRLRGVSILKLSPFSWLPQIGVPQIPQLAEGGQGDGGSALVGEQGPELLDLPKGATVIPLQRSSISIGIEDLNEKMENLIGIVEALIGQKIGVYLNGRALVGELTPDINDQLGRLAFADGRYR